MDVVIDGVPHRRYVPCPHGPSTPRYKSGHCIACHNERRRDFAARRAAAKAKREEVKT